MRAIVTVKLSRNLHHNPHNKKTGRCPLSIESKHYEYKYFCGIPIGTPEKPIAGSPFLVQDSNTFIRTCTDTTGSHHSYVEEGTSVEDITRKAKAMYGHVTRVEVFEK